MPGQGSYGLFDVVDLTNQATESSPRTTDDWDTLQVHHTAGTSDAANRAAFDPGGRTVSANGFLRSTARLDEIVLANRRAFTSASSADNWCFTVETTNQTGAPEWGISEAQRVRLARLAVDLFKLRLSGAGRGLRHLGRGRGGIIGHNETPGSYPTACPGPSMHLDHISALAQQMWAAEQGPPPPPPKTPEQLDEEYWMSIKDEVLIGVSALLAAHNENNKREDRHRLFSANGYNAAGQIGSVIALDPNLSTAKLQATVVSERNPLTIPPSEAASFAAGNMGLLSVPAFFRQVDTYLDGFAPKPEYGEWQCNEFELRQRPDGSWPDTRHVRDIGSFTYPNRQDVWNDLRPVTVTYGGVKVTDFFMENGYHRALLADGQVVGLTGQEATRADAQRVDGQDWARR